MLNEEEIVAAKEAFHVAKLALFNVRTLNDLEMHRHKSDELNSLIERRASADNVSSPISLLNQATFQQFSYVCLVWLWEQSKTTKWNEEMMRLVETRFNFQNVIKSAVGPRKVEKPSHVIRIVRNAISHARVISSDNSFIFSDIDTRNQEEEPTTVELSWMELGQLSEAVLFSTSDKLYKNC